jgi:RNA polymerase sigma factor (sigma-70 family)
MTASLTADPDVVDRSIAELLAGIGDRDPASWSEIVRRFEPMLLGRARRYQLQQSDVLDAVQTTWLRLAENWHRVENPERLGGWLATTLHRECLRILRARRSIAPDDGLVERATDPNTGPEQRLVAAETVAAVRRLIDGLHARHRELLDALFDGDDRPYADLSRRMSIPIGSIGPTRARCLRRLRVQIEAQGLAPHD